ncbi:Uncharacterised protein [Salmonella enterica subsp. enterica]|uniref:Uncharacterized protein n=1 Tax=Salmonella enterica I TaxID=59201 RepID=A0A3S5DDX3_SALET|nr:Uncharacterised protein [Salmonella enterica subsp. enterica]
MGDHIRVQRGDRVHNVVELAVTHVGVDLGFILRHRRVDAEGFHTPFQIGVQSLRRSGRPSRSAGSSI